MNLHMKLGFKSKLNLKAENAVCKNKGWGRKYNCL